MMCAHEWTGSSDIIDLRCLAMASIDVHVIGYGVPLCVSNQPSLISCAIVVNTGSLRPALKECRSRSYKVPGKWAWNNASVIY